MIVQLPRVHPRSTRALGGVHRDVGTAEQLVARRPVLWRDGDSDARPRLERNAGDLEQLGDHGSEPLGNDERARRVGCVLGDDGELVTAEARDELSGAERGGEPLRDLDEQLVAAVVTERVVDLLEPVEVDEEDRERDRRRRSVAELVESAAELRPIRQPRQVVVERQVRDRVELAMEPPCRRAHHGDEAEPEQDEHELEDGRDGDRSLASGAGDRPVVLVDRHHAGRAVGEPERRERPQDARRPDPVRDSTASLATIPERMLARSSGWSAPSEMPAPGVAATTRPSGVATAAASVSSSSTRVTRSRRSSACRAAVSGRRRSAGTRRSTTPCVTTLACSIAVFSARPRRSAA